MFPKLFEMLQQFLAAKTPETEPEDSPENIRAVYQALCLKRSTFDLMLWQAPMISLTAQAFLLQIAFGNQCDLFDKILLGLAATTVGFASWQLFVRHSAMERQASYDLQVLETKHFSEKAHYKPRCECCKIANQRSKPVWRLCLLLVSFIGAVPLVRFAFHF